MHTFLAFLHLLGLVVWLGSVIFFSFFTAPSVFKVLDRQQAGDVIAAIFPKYYGVGYTCAVLVAATALATPHGASGLRMPFLVVMAACTFYAGLVINPQARRLKHQMREAGGEDDALQNQFRSLHGWSVRLNATVLIFGLGLLWITAMGLRL
ncbi:DUF4149 domain-containing protein [Nitrospina watsonii]|uniref:TMEM205-like domain-containing protein n=1 Tax=Nitrospina watsonii TaxID=1323948 RepID=A0ABM9HH40_9BACT|nr:DUF4149 domain-containing protein [Nitrospina watsonii]CAI2719674.1 conserved membrane protein of unknown function [Nitrospina watsonii]